MKKSKIIKYIIVKRKIDDFFYSSFKEAQREADDDSIIIEIETKELRRFKKGDWQEVKTIS